MANVKGSKLTSKLVFVTRSYGSATTDKVLAALAPEDRAELSAVIDLRWYPIALYERLLQAIVNVAAGGDGSVLDRIGAHSAEHQLSNIYSAYRRDDLVRMLKNMVPMHSHMNDPGRMEVATNGNGALTIIVTEPKSTGPACRVSRAFYKRTAKTAGATAVRVIETTCTSRGEDACRFEIHAS